MSSLISIDLSVSYHSTYKVKSSNINAYSYYKHYKSVTIKVSADRHRKDSTPPLEALSINLLKTPIKNFATIFKLGQSIPFPLIFCIMWLYSHQYSHISFLYSLPYSCINLLQNPSAFHYS